MYDLENELNEFLNEKVVLSRDDQNQLKKLRRINITRLKDGLDEYNDEQNTSYKITNHIIQGSTAMFTVIQKEKNESSQVIEAISNAKKEVNSSNGVEN